MNKKIIYIDMDDVIVDFYTAYDEYRRSHPGIQFPQATLGFFEKMLPIEGAIDAVNTLRSNSRFSVYILTAPSVKNPISYTEKRLWIEKYFGFEFCERLIICSNKGLLKGDFLIDDNIKGKGQEKFEGQLIHFGSKESSGWLEVLSMLN